ncbi:hypothetical protein PG990_002554 [Apiospora arundinis]
MPVTIKPSTHGANPLRDIKYANSATQILREADYAYRSVEEWGVVTSSFRPTGDKSSPRPDGEGVFASSNGLVMAAAAAYAQHHYLVIRPEDVWHAITTQLQFYINGHAAELRHLFVSHQGKQELKIEVVDPYDVPLIAKHFETHLEEKVLDPSLPKWFLPDFSTTTPDDITVASIVAMGAYSNFFRYFIGVICGLPSVTLLGERADYEKILQRLDRLCEFGQEPSEFCGQLRPILRRFVRTFDFPEEKELKEFWNNICTRHHETMCGGSEYYSGWITAFCFWQPEGQRTEYHDLVDREARMLLDPVPARLMYDGVTYNSVDIETVPSGFAKVPVTILPISGPSFEAVFLAGSVAVRCKSSGEATTSGHKDLDTVQPQLGWFMYEQMKFPSEQEDK